jgi:hypothetical protein
MTVHPCGGPDDEIPLPEMLDDFRVRIGVWRRRYVSELPREIEDASGGGGADANTGARPQAGVGSPSEQTADR